MAYATEYDIAYRWTPNAVLFSKHRHTIPRDDRSVWAIATPLDARSLSKFTTSVNFILNKDQELPRVPGQDGVATRVDGPMEN